MRFRSGRRLIGRSKREPAGSSEQERSRESRAPQGHEAAPEEERQPSEASKTAGKFRDDYEKQVEEELAEEEQIDQGRSGLGALIGGWRLFPRAFRYVRPYKRRAGGSLVFTVFLALLALAEPWPLAFVIDTVLGDKPPPPWLRGLFGDTNGRLILVAVVATLLISLLTGLFTVLNQYIQTTLSGRMSLDFRSDILQHIQRLSFTWHDNMRTGILMYRMTGGANAIDLIVRLPTYGQSLITMVGMGWIAYQLDPLLARLAMIVLPLMYFSLVYYANRIEPVVKRVRAMEGMSLAIAHEVASMVRVIVSFGRERHEYDRFRDQAEQAIDARVSLTLRQTAFNLVMNLITAGGTAAVLGVGAYQVLNGHLSAGELLVIMSYIGQVYVPLENLATFLTTSQQTFIMFEYALRLLDEQPDVVEKSDAIALERSRGELTLEGVGFSYETREHVLKDISFSVDPGRAVAIVGPTGAGKSTLVSLLPRFYDPSVGRVTLDGVDLRDLKLASLRAQFSIVLQEPLLFTGTIHDNIRYGKPDATDEEVIEAAKAANAHTFIMNLPEGYKTPLGERGAKISGGERQRIAIARAFLRDAPILILDEPTSSVDSRTEGVILDALERLMAGRTTIMIAHRLSTIRSADHIIVLDGGEIVEQGTHDELVEQQGLYRQLWKLQVRQRRWKPSASGPMTLTWKSVPADGATTDRPNGRKEARRRARRDARRRERRAAAAPDTGVPGMIRWEAPPADGANADLTERAGANSSQPEPPADVAAAIRDIDHVLVLNDGNVVQFGTHEELMVQQGPYREAWVALFRRFVAAGNGGGTTAESTDDSPEPQRSKFAAAAERSRSSTPDNGSGRVRLAEIQNEQRVLVMERGQFVQSGTHEELVEQEGPYRDVWGRLQGDRDRTEDGPPTPESTSENGDRADTIGWSNDEVEE